MIDLTSYLEISNKPETRLVMTCYVRLDKKTILSALAAESIFINGKYFKVPESRLLECLINRSFGETKLDLEEIVMPPNPLDKFLLYKVQETESQIVLRVPNDIYRQMDVEDFELLKSSFKEVIYEQSAMSGNFVIVYLKL